MVRFQIGLERRFPAPSKLTKELARSRQRKELVYIVHASIENDQGLGRAGKASPSAIRPDEGIGQVEAAQGPGVREPVEARIPRQGNVWQVKVTPCLAGILASSLSLMVFPPLSLPFVAN